MRIFDDATIATRQQRTARALSAAINADDVVLVFCGEPIQKPGGHDQNYPFLPHPDYLWLTGSRRPFGVSAFTKGQGWIDFIKPVSRDEKVWEGGAQVIPGRSVEELESWLAKLSPARIFSLGQPGKKDHRRNVSDEEAIEVQETFNEVRRIKDAAEVALVRRLASAANAGYARMPSFIRPGVSERDIQLEYEALVLKAGAEKMPYESIVGTGTNGAILHAIPTPRIVKSGELVLIDAGADIHDYCVDITRVFAADGKFSTRQQNIYDIVMRAQSASIALMRPGTEWLDVHRASSRTIGQGLKDLGIIRGDVEDAMNSGAVAVFFPHGVGHMVGLRVRDVGGKLTKSPKVTAGARVRVDLPLQEGFLMTVEPGVYFIDALISDPTVREKFSDQINWSEVEKWRDFGGVRIEDDILVTATGHENLTAVVAK